MATLFWGDTALLTDEELAYWIGYLIPFMAGWTLCGFAGYVIGRRKRRGLAGFLLGVLLGPIGWILIAFFETDGKQCPYCCSLVPREAIRCRHCRSDLTSPSRNNPFSER